VTPTPHSEQGARKGEHPGRSSNPVIKVHDLAWLEFQKPDLVRAEAFAQAFGFTTVSRSGDELQLRGSDSGSPCVLIRRGPTSRFVGAAFRAVDEADVLRLADANGAATHALPETIGGLAVDLVDPSGMPVRVVAGTRQLEALPAQSAQTAQASISIMRSRMASAETCTAVLAGGRAVSTYSSRIVRTSGSIAMSVT